MPKVPVCRRYELAKLKVELSKILTVNSFPLELRTCLSLLDYKSFYFPNKPYLFLNAEKKIINLKFLTQIEHGMF